MFRVFLEQISRIPARPIKQKSISSSAHARVRSSALAEKLNERNLDDSHEDRAVVATEEARKTHGFVTILSTSVVIPLKLLGRDRSCDLEDVK